MSGPQADERANAANAAVAALAEFRTDDGWLTASSREGRFASLFGRDALIAALQYLPYDPAVADATLERLGRELGARDDPETEEEPGRVPHEIRDADLDAYVAHGWPVRDGRLRYYGTVDANSWWLLLYGALARHGVDVRRHRVAGGRVADWLAGRPQPLTYARRATSGGLAHHWWRDVAADRAEDPTQRHGMFADDGTQMRAPVAVAAVQALAWRALDEAATLLDPAYAVPAGRARAAFAGAFLAEPGAPPAFARHAGGLAASASSDLGTILWTGILEPRCAAATAARLLETDLATEHGLRTLPTGHPAFRPDGYHAGAVWPWDTWMGAAGVDGAIPGAGRALWDGMAAAVARLGGFPELYAVGPGGALQPAAEACTVQAWTAGAVAAVQAAWDGRTWGDTG